MGVSQAQVQRAALSNPAAYARYLAKAKPGDPRAVPGGTARGTLSPALRPGAGVSVFSATRSDRDVLTRTNRATPISQLYGLSQPSLQKLRNPMNASGTAHSQPTYIFNIGNATAGTPAGAPGNTASVAVNPTPLGGVAPNDQGVTLGQLTSSMPSSGSISATQGSGGVAQLPAYSNTPTGDSVKSLQETPLAGGASSSSSTMLLVAGLAFLLLMR